MSCSTNNVKSLVSHVDNTKRIIAENSIKHTELPRNYHEQLANEFLFTSPENFQGRVHDQHMGLRDAFFDSVRFNVPDIKLSSAEIQQLEEHWDNNQSLNDVWNKSNFETLWNGYAQESSVDWATEFQKASLVTEQANPKEIQEVSGGILDLVDSTNPKFRNSKFVKFLKGLANGSLEIQDNDIVEKNTDHEWASEYGEYHVNDNHNIIDGNQGSSVPYNYGYHRETHWEEEFVNHNESKQEAQNWANEFQSNKLKTQYIENDPEYNFPKWTDDYYKNISPVVDRESIEDWQKLKKGWHEYPATGFGYANYALKAFGYSKFTGNFYEKAVELIQNESEVQAIQCLHSNLKETPDHLPSLEALASLYYNQQCIPDMLHTINMFLLNSEYRDDAISLISSAPQVEGISLPENVQSLVNCLHELIKRKPDSRLHSFLSLIYSAFNYNDQSIQLLRQAIEITPGSFELLNRLGALLTKKIAIKKERDYSEAIECFRQALKMNPLFNRAHFNLALCYIQLELYKTAIKHILCILKTRVDIEEDDEVWKLLECVLDYMNWGKMLHNNPKDKVITELEYILERA
jgi:peroxin-5